MSNPTKTCLNFTHYKCLTRGERAYKGMKIDLQYVSLFCYFMTLNELITRRKRDLSLQHGGCTGCG